MQKNKELEIDKEKLAAEVRCCLEQHIVELSGQIHQAINQILAEKSCNILQMTVMRADLYQGAPMLAVRGYDERWYLDEDPKTIYLPVPYLWTPFAQVYEQMQRKLSVYMGAVSEYDIRN